ncbi:MAG TPA: DUF305 domain-containing protein [Candidatus Paceibacterota bacterium]|jgi:uncharacterized protein (DUF305 family)|nr:DUF305 domain-containing protein [Candidatus Paceibacterota bacterium]
MENKTVLIAGVALIAGLVLGYTFAPRMPGNNMGMGNVDAHFIEQMIPHHEGAIEMAELALERSKDERVRTLSQEIIDAQTDEIGKMQQWYQEWFDRAPTESMGHGGMHMQGMEGDVDALQAASDFDREFIAQMIVHHEMAVMMAQMLESGTSRTEMKELAKNIVSSQTREIETMRDWLSVWPQ